MPDYRNTRNQRVITVADKDAFRFANSPNWELIQADPFVVPVGTVAEILAWAGDDPERKLAARLAELAGKNRASLLAKL